MAQIVSGFNFTGSIGNFSAYKMRGSDKIIIRVKGGASKNKIKKSPAFANTRSINAEFSGRSTASKWIMRMLHPHKALADYNIAGPLNALVKPIQDMDTGNEYGRRSVLFSKNPKLLEGFNLNRHNVFDSIVRNPPSVDLSKDKLKARIEIPALLPGINFYVPGKYPLFGFTATLGMLPDLFFSANGYRPANNEVGFFPSTKESKWFVAMKGSTATVLEMDLKPPPPDISFSLMLSIGICFGNPGEKDSVQQIPHAGAAKILAMA